MRVVITGDRHWTNWRFIYATLDEIHKITPISVLIEGEAKGADSFARNWAKDRGIPFEAYPAQWHRYRHGAGPIRNKQMIIEGKPDFGVAFHNDIANSSGTKDMVEKMTQFNVPFVIMKDTE